MTFPIKPCIPQAIDDPSQCPTSAIAAFATACTDASVTAITDAERRDPTDPESLLNKSHLVLLNLSGTTAIRFRGVYSASGSPAVPTGLAFVFMGLNLPGLTRQQSSVASIATAEPRRLDATDPEDAARISLTWPASIASCLRGPGGVYYSAETAEVDCRGANLGIIIPTTAATVTGTDGLLKIQAIGIN